MKRREHGAEPSAGVAWRIVELRPESYGEVRRLWEETPGVQLARPDHPDGADSPDGIRRFLQRNPGLSFLAVSSGESAGSRVLGAVLAGSDGRRGYLHHLAVAAEHRRRGIGAALVAAATAALRSQGIEKCHLFALADKDLGGSFWRNRGWQRRDDLHMYSLQLGE
mgnify:CR=1 FL=1